ncbi:GMC oxidoreductase-domain-containing protein [Lentinula detonsa]|uniref:GMC oxidoreductase-domain-containing protein n=1 Tax=Lentinula detonsa TaxID=2804962 RepID=A0AA38Q3N0_9AGAR|nr:GMC oxidoreductase-domain-containing protein [Lentinula detonsa]
MMNTPPADFDIIFGGGGTAACVAAGRLAAANPTLRILVLEAGEHTKNEDSHVQPGRYFGHLSPASTTLKFHVGKPSEALAGRSLVIPSGRCIGGGSSVNFTMYTRASASDYDDWETQFKNPGWGSQYLLPLLRKTETYQAQPNQPTHGYSGPLKVSWGGHVTNVANQFLEVAAATDHNRTHTEDANDFYECNKYGKWPKWIDGETGKRSDPAHYYIYNQGANENLVIRTGQQVKRVLFEGEKAVGLEYVADRVLRPDADQAPQQVYASRLVVLSSGAFGSPAILERSGIGAADLLAKHDIPVKVDLPAVGENFQDHNICFVPYQASDEAETFDALIRGDIAETTKNSDLWIEGKGLLAANGMDAGIKIRPITEQDFAELGPEFEGRWNDYFVNAPDKPVIWFGPSSFLLGDHTTAPVRRYFSMAYVNEYPISMGSVHISSGEDPHAPSDFNPAFLNHPADLATLRWGYKRTREIARRMKYYRGEHLPIHPDFAAGSEALCSGEVSGPITLDAPRLKYTEEDDKAIDDFHRKFIQTSWHSVSIRMFQAVPERKLILVLTARDMCNETSGGRRSCGPSVERLWYHKFESCRVGFCFLDLSIAPANVGANTYSSALTVGEKAAVIIAEDLGLQIDGVGVLETSEQTISGLEELVPAPPTKTKLPDDFAGLEGIEGLTISSMVNDEYTNSKPAMITVM